MRGVTQGHRGRVPAGKAGERGLSCGTIRGAILVQPGLPASISRDTLLCHLLFVTCSLGSWMNFQLRHTKKHLHRNTPGMLITISFPHSPVDILLDNLIPPLPTPQKLLGISAKPLYLQGVVQVSISLQLTQS